VPDRLRLAPVAPAAAAPSPADPAAEALAAALVGLLRLPALLERLVAAAEHPAPPPGAPARPGPAVPEELVRLPELLQQLTEAIGRIGQPERRLAFRKDELAKALGISVETLTKSIHRGECPGPSAFCGRVPIWSTEAIRAWLAGETRTKKC
jgi:hypothetical protein